MASEPSPCNPNSHQIVFLYRIFNESNDGYIQLITAILLVGTGGFLGSILRFWLFGWVFRVLGKPWFPVGTLAVNVIGCHVIGFLGEVVGQRRIFNQELRLFLFVGVLGGFTIFSAFAYETSSMLRDSRLYGTWLNVGLQIVLGLLAVRLGVLSSR